MALVVMRDAWCPECQGEHSVNEPNMHMPRRKSDGRIRRRCAECIKEEHDAKVAAARHEADSAAWNESAMLEAEISVLRNELFGRDRISGRDRMVEYWNRVKKELTK